MTRVSVLLALQLAACGPGQPEFESQLTPPARGTPYPAPVPLEPLLAGVDEVQPRDAADEGTELAERAEDLRRRAAILRNTPF